MTAMPDERTWTEAELMELGRREAERRRKIRQTKQARGVSDETRARMAESQAGAWARARASGFADEWGSRIGAGQRGRQNGVRRDRRQPAVPTTEESQPV